VEDITETETEREIEIEEIEGIEEDLIANLRVEAEAMIEEEKIEEEDLHLRQDLDGKDLDLKYISSFCFYLIYTMHPPLLPYIYANSQINYIYKRS